ncbi:dolichyl-phosphate-mannose-protein mannosyltransferase [Microbacterium sp. W4I4]|uniref:dolichyl-phosphate-mannose--protein mannosyltransferase n=1 Tax=Microbacterium sp. W4I4 TaxID=3042295 RepID=UPI0027899C4C|nr:phospholipid carrier-dependent glycosyltransferase [Microbacterium sp. W4I4]MDQ0615828.1 dolichyl-phosphate-mannose-protein mannosyltransferase [Microbacterium sp. W4I4]
MTENASLLPPVDRRPTAYEALRDRVLGDPRLNRMLGWSVPALITLLAAALRLINLAHPHQIMFDETYYVKDSWSLWNLGYEAKWGDGADTQLLTGDDSALQAEGSFVVHPPLGKWIIALGMAAMGPGSSFGWRVTTALLGSLTVLLVYLVALQLTRSRTVASIAAGLLAIDGLGIVMSRIALLDGILTFFILLGALFVLKDRQRTMPLLDAIGRDDDEDAPLRMIGPVLWNRPWLIAAGVTLGAASAVKWSGLYALAVFGLHVVVTDALARRRAGIALWPTDAVFRQGPASFLLLVGPALLTYLVSWTGWLVTAGGYDRQSDANPLAALWKYHESILAFHVGLATPHPYASPAWQWPLLLRPTAIWVGEKPTGCGTDHCIAVISSVPNPMIWYASVAAALYLLYWLVRGLIQRTPVGPELTFSLVGLIATYVPWLLVGDRTIFQFYTITMVPFLVIGLALALRELAGRAPAPRHRRQSGQRTVVVYLAVVVLVSAFYYPVWTGMSVPYEFWLIHNWLPGWI